MKHLTSHIILLTSCLLLLCSCEADLRELCYDHDHSGDEGKTAELVLELKLDIDIDLDVEVSIEAHTEIIAPEYMKVCFYDPERSNLRSTEFVEAEGGPLHTAPGKYRMVAYSFGTEWTQIRGEGDINTLEAFTSDITATKMSALAGFITRADEEPQYEAPGPIIYTPDHLLVAYEPVDIPVPSIEHPKVTIQANAATIVKTYAFEVTNVNGLQYIQSVEAFVTNQARSNYFGRGELNTDPATIYFPVEINREKGDLETTFNTFGKLPGESHSYLHILLTSTDGTEIRISTDITDQFEKPDQTIIIDEPIDIPKPEEGEGGIAPTVDPWEEENTDVPIG